MEEDVQKAGEGAAGAGALFSKVRTAQQVILLNCNFKFHSHWLLIRTCIYTWCVAQVMFFCEMSC